MRRLPEETFADFVDAGLMNVGKPIRFGGTGLEIDTMYEVAAELGRGDGLAARCYSILNDSSWLIGQWPEQAQSRRRPDGTTVSHSVIGQMRLAEASAEADAARTLMRQSYREVLCRASGGETHTMLDRARVRRDHGFAVDLAVRAVSRLFEGGGGNAARDSNPLQRFHRDILAASQHVALRWDEHREQYGRVAFGLEPSTGARV